MSDNWKKLVPSCFGSVDGLFAMHPMDEIQARELRKECKKNGITLNEILEECESYLHNENATPEHIAEQIKKIRKKFSSLA